ncbi:MAG TPA: PAS domain-containing sensor histidine kinase [Ktedonobacterales bacterium]
MAGDVEGTHETLARSGGKRSDASANPSRGARSLPRPRWLRSRPAPTSADELRHQTVALVASFEALSDAVTVFDAHGHLLHANAAARALFELDARADALDQQPGELARLLMLRDAQGEPLPDDQMPVARVLRGEVLREEHAQDVLYRQHNGEDRLVTITGNPLRATGGRVIGAVTVARDVTQRRRLELQTQAALTALLRVAALVTDPERSADPARVLAQIAEALQLLEAADYAHALLVTEDSRLVPLAMVGVTPKQEAAWRAQVEVSNAQEAPSAARAEALAALQAGTVLAQRFDRDAALVTPRAVSELGVRTAITTPVIVGGRLIGLLVIGRTRSPERGTASGFAPWDEALLLGVGRLAGEALERATLAHQLTAARAAQLAAEETTRQRDEFLSVASHELRTPLTSVKANAQVAERTVRRLLATSAVDGKRAGEQGTTAVFERLHEQLVRADRQATLLARLVDDLVDVSRIHADRLELRRAPCDLVAIAREAVAEQRQVQPQRRIALELPRGGEPVPLEADAARIGQVLINLLTNALKYSPPESPVAVTVSVNDGQARVSVRDEGPGLSAEQRERLGERFYRVPGIEVQSGSGVGLGIGLFISKTIVERHGGTLGVESAPGAGSTFWFELPLTADE